MSDKTWKFQNDSDDIKIVLNKNTYNKPDEAIFKVDAKNSNFSAYIDPKKWKFKGKSESDDDKLTFAHKNIDLYGMVISE